MQNSTLLHGRSNTYQSSGMYFVANLGSLASQYITISYTQINFTESENVCRMYIFMVVIIASCISHITDLIDDSY
jgi:hypothetical protein